MVAAASLPKVKRANIEFNVSARVMVRKTERSRAEDSETGNGELPKSDCDRVEFVPLREQAGGLYTIVLAKPADSGQSFPSMLSQGFAAGEVATICGKMELFWALCRGGVADDARVVQRQ